MKTITVRIDDELHKQLVACAAKEHRSISNLIKTIILDYMDREEQKNEG